MRLQLDPFNTDTQTQTHTHTHTHTHTDTDSHTHRHTDTHAHTQTHRYPDTRKQAHTHVCMCKTCGRQDECLGADASSCPRRCKRGQIAVVLERMEIEGAGVLAHREALAMAPHVYVGDTSSSIRAMVCACTWKKGRRKNPPRGHKRTMRRRGEGGGVRCICAHVGGAAATIAQWQRGAGGSPP